MGSPLTGQAAALAANPLSPTVSGGLENSVRGRNANTAPSANGNGPVTQPSPFAGKGALLEQPDDQVFKVLDDLVRRQLPLFQSHLAYDIHWTRVKLGNVWSQLEKDADRNTYKVSLPPGVSSLSIQAVPNLLHDYIRKATTALLSDFPKPDPEALNTSEEASFAADMARRFLTQDGGPRGTNDESLFAQLVERALTCASTYADGWVDPVGGGYVPLEVKAHPQATDVANPLIGPDGMPTDDPVLRYVTAPTAEAPSGQFTDDPSQADRMWLPKIRVNQLGREHVRVYPETSPVENADQVIVIYYCTLGEGKRRWPALAQMDDRTLAGLTDWTPPVYLPLLPPQLRARWKMGALGSPEGQKSGGGDQRLVWYYKLLQRPSMEYPEGARLYVSGWQKGFVIDRATLGMDVQVPARDGTGPKTERRCRQFELIQVTPVTDPDERDPSGRAYAELMGGACDYANTLATHYLEKIDTVLHAEGYLPGVSTVDGTTREDARATGDLISVRSKDDLPFFAAQPPMPPGFLEVMQWAVQAVESIASLPKPVTGGDRQQEVSGKARQIAVQQGQIGLSGMNGAVKAAVERYYQMKLELAQSEFPVPLMISYTGDDGAFTQESFNAQDFALVGRVGIVPGSGSMMSPDAKVQYVANAQAAGLMDQAQAKTVARSVFGATLGGDEDPHAERADRCIALWLKGASPAWLQQFQQQQQAQEQFQQAQAQFGQANAGFQQHAQAMQAQGLPPQMPAPVPPQPPQLPPLFDPFDPRPNDAEPGVANTWLLALSKLLSTARYAEQPAPWRALVDKAYQRFAATLQQAQTGVNPQPGSPDQTYAAFKQKIDALVGNMAAALLAKEAGQQLGVAAPSAAPAPPPAQGVAA